MLKNNKYLSKICNTDFIKDDIIKRTVIKFRIKGE